MIVDRFRRQAERLGPRLAGMIIIALLPLGLLSFMQTRDALALSDETRLLAAIGETMQVGNSEIRVTRSAQNAARLLASTLTEGLPDPVDCDAKVRAFAASEVAASLVAFVPVTGRASCTSDQKPRDYSPAKRFAKLMAHPAPSMFADPEWSDDGAEVLSVSHPVRDANGQLAGMVLINVPQPTLAAGLQAIPRTTQRDKAVLIAMDGGGNIIYSSIGIQAAQQELPQKHSLASLAQKGVFSFFGQSQNGQPHIFATVPVSDDLYFLGIWPHGGVRGFWRAAQPYILPLLMWMAAAVVALLGAERLVTRHIRRLSDDMNAFAMGERNPPEMQLPDPPHEIASLADAYQTMTQTILHDEAELENLLRQKQELLREVHHRTGNSLQLIASFLRMHRRETQDEEVCLILDDLHNRVMSLSSVHMGLYRMAGRAEIAVDELMAEVTTKVGLVSGRTGRKGRISSELDPVVLGSEQAVPLALFLAEALSAFPVSDAEGGKIRIRLALLENSRARLSIAGNETARGRLTGERDGAPSIIAARLIRGFVSQLDGTLEVLDLPDHEVEIRVTFVARQPSVEQPAFAPVTTEALRNSPPLQ